MTLSGTNQAINGSTTFYNLQATGSTARTLTFASGQTQTVTNDLTLTGCRGPTAHVGSFSGCHALESSGT